MRASVTKSSFLDNYRHSLRARRLIFQRSISVCFFHQFIQRMNISLGYSGINLAKGDSLYEKILYIYNIYIT